MKGNTLLKRHVSALAAADQLPSWWEPLYDASANRSIFLSGSWLQSWLAVYGAGLRGIWARWEHEGATVGGCLVLSQVVWKSFVPLRSLFLNATAETVERAPLAEFNDILHLSGFEEAIAADFARLLREERWSRLLIHGHEDGGVMRHLVPMFPRTLVEQEVKPAPFVDLAGMHQESFEATLTRNTRGQIRRSQKLYERRSGAMTIDVASSVEKALEYLDQLVRLSNFRWRSKGVRGSLENPVAQGFHRRLIASLWPRNAVDLVRVRAGDAIVGYFYNFIDRGKVYFFQSGLAYENDARLKPGLVSHALAIEHYKRRGLREYDFLASDARYKRSLAKQHRDLYWTVLYRDLPWIRFLLLARRLKQAAVSLFRRPKPDPQYRHLRILVLGSDTRSFLSTVRSLGRAGHEILVAWAADGGAALSSRYISKNLALSPYRINDDTWVSEFQELLSKHSIDLVVPCSDPMIVPLQAAQHRIRTRARLYVLPDEVHRITSSKLEMHRIADELGIPVAKTVVASCEDDARMALNTLQAPWVFKPEYSYFDTDLATRNVVRKAYTREEGIDLASELLAKGRFQIQENFVGTGTGVEVLCERGEILLAFQHLRVHEPLRGGGSSYRRGIPVHPGMLDATREIMARLRYTGVAMAEFKWNQANGRWIFIELNARFWGSLPLAVASGADFPRALVDLLMFGRRSISCDIRTDLYARDLASDLEWLLSNFRADKKDPTLSALPWGSVLREFLNVLRGKERWDTWAVFDPVPFLLEIAEILGGKLRSLARRISYSNYCLAATRPWRRRRLLDRLPRAKNIAFVCYGNICRSPFAEFYARNRRRGINFFSAGFHRAAGRLPPEAAIAAAGTLGIDLSAHRSRRLTSEAARTADVLLAFDTRNIRDIHSRFPEVRARTFLLSDLGVPARISIEDPWGRDQAAFLATYRRIQSCIDAMTP